MTLRPGFLPPASGWPPVAYGGVAVSRGPQTLAVGDGERYCTGSGGEYLPHPCRERWSNASDQIRDVAWGATVTCSMIEAGGTWWW